VICLGVGVYSAPGSGVGLVRSYLCLEPSLSWCGGLCKIWSRLVWRFPCLFTQQNLVNNLIHFQDFDLVLRLKSFSTFPNIFKRQIQINNALKLEKVNDILKFISSPKCCGHVTWLKSSFKNVNLWNFFFSYKTFSKGFFTLAWLNWDNLLKDNKLRISSESGINLMIMQNGKSL